MWSVYADEVRIGKIHIECREIFDPTLPSSTKFPYKLLNRLHIETKEDFVRSELLFKEGDSLDWTLIQESERILRSRPIFRFVKIVVMPAQNGVSDVVIQTEDIWSTSIQLAYGTAGGENFYRLGFLEHNFLGRGKSIGAFIRQDIDRTTKGFSYQDPHLFGSPWTISGGYGQDQKGHEWETKISKPYISFRTPSSYGGRVRFYSNEDRLFEGGDESAKFIHHEQQSRAFASKAFFGSEHVVHRLSLSHDYEKDEFDDIRLTQPLPIPVDRTTSGVLTGYEFRQENFIKRKTIHTFDRFEDINLGWNLLAEAGPSSTKLGATRNGWLANGLMKKAVVIQEKILLLFDWKTSGRMEKGVVKNGDLTLQGESYYQNWWGPMTLVNKGQARFGKNLDPETQYLLGGENGLRGYSVRQFSGSKKFLFSLENRGPLLNDKFNLVHLGWAIFYDMGNVEKEGHPLSINRMKHDVGMGFRFAPSRSYDPSLIRIDVAYALNDNDRPSRWVFNIGADLRFDRSEPRKFDQ